MRATILLLTVALTGCAPGPGGDTAHGTEAAPASITTKRKPCPGSGMSATFDLGGWPALYRVEECMGENADSQCRAANSEVDEYRTGTEITARCSHPSATSLLLTVVR